MSFLPRPYPMEKAMHPTGIDFAWIEALRSRSVAIDIDGDIEFFYLLRWLWDNHAARDRFIKACQAGNVGGGVNDLITDYQNSFLHGAA